MSKTSQSTANDTAARLERDTVARAYRKVMDREDLTAREREALARHERKKEENLRWQYYRSIPHKHWRSMSGRQSKVIREQAQRYGIPFDGPAVNLPDVVRALHDFLAENATKLSREDDALLQGANSPALERYREERAALARLDRLERENRLLPRDDVRDALAQIASVLRQAGETLHREFGHAAAEILYEALDDAERQSERAFGKAANDAPDAK